MKGSAKPPVNPCFVLAAAITTDMLKHSMIAEETIPKRTPICHPWNLLVDMYFVNLESRYRTGAQHLFAKVDLPAEESFVLQTPANRFSGPWTGNEDASEEVDAIDEDLEIFAI